MELDRHGISDIILYTEAELESAICAVNPLIMNVFDLPHIVLYGKTFFKGLYGLFSKVTTGHTMRLGKDTWKIRYTVE